MNMEDIEKEIKSLTWNPTLSHTEKAEHIILLMNCVYAMAYEQGVDDTKNTILRVIYNELGE